MRRRFASALILLASCGQFIEPEPKRPPIISYESPMAFAVGVAASSAVNSTGGPATAFSISPPLPSGLELDASTGAVGGVALAGSAQASYTVIASGPGGSDTATFLLSVTVPAPEPGTPRPQIAYATPVTDTAGKAAAHAVVSTGGPITGFSVSPPLPPGLKLNAATGLISGTPAAPAPVIAYNVIAYGPGGRDTAVINITVAVSPTIAPPEIAYISPVTDTVGRPAAHSVISTGGPVTRYRLLDFPELPPPILPKAKPSIIALLLPDGLTLDSSTGMISGTPTQGWFPATYFIVATGPGGSDTAYINITVVDARPVITYASPVTDTVGRPAVHDVISTGGPVTRYSLPVISNDPLVDQIFALPPGLTLNAATGRISGTPALALGASNYRVIAEGPYGRDTAILNISVISNPSPLPAPLLYWDFNEGAGTTLTDRAGGGRNATISGATWTTGIQGTALRFDGVNDYAESMSAIPDMEQQTMMAWVYLEGIKDSYLIADGDTESGHDNLLSVHANGRFRYRTRDADPFDQHNSRSQLLTGQWYHLAGVSTGDTVRVYLNGALDTLYTGRTYNLTGYHYRIQFGRFADGLNRTPRDYLQGVLDEVKVFDQALTPAQIQAEYLRNVQIVLGGDPPNFLP